MTDANATPALNPPPADQGLVPVTALDTLSRSEIDAQIATARKYPRSLPTFLREAMDMACHDAETAASCYYVLKRKNRDGGETIIEGPSIRLAEIVTSAWGNVVWGAQPVAVDRESVTVMGFCLDLQKNVRRAAYLRRKILDRNGRRYSDDMVTMTTNAAGAIAARNAVFSVIPRAYVDQIVRACRKVAVGDAKTLEARRQAALAYFAKMGIGMDRILAALSVESPEDITGELLEQLQGAATAIKDGDTSPDEAFPPVVKDTQSVGHGVATTRTGKLAEEIKGKGREPGADG